jgi:hypothetical protein
MMARLELPTDKRDLADALDSELIMSEQEAGIHTTTHKIVDAYLSGVRKFRILDRWSGNLSIAFENSRGDLEMRYEEINRLYLAEVGRYLKMDINPTAAKKGEGLDAVRKAAIGNATLGALAAPLPLDSIKRQAVVPFIKHGTVGLNHIETGMPDMPDMVEIVPARQLRGMPAWVDGTGNLHGIARKRWVPLGWLVARMKKIFGKKMRLDRMEQDLRARDVPYGGHPPDELPHGASGSGEGLTWNVQKRDLIGLNVDGSYKHMDKLLGPRKDVRSYVPLEEIYIFDDTGQFMARYIIKVGDVIFHDENFEEQGVRMLCPLHVARHTDIGKMFARGFVAPLMPINDQIEKMIKSVFKNIAELDMYGTLMVPGGSGIDLKNWKTGPRPKIESFNPDPLNPSIMPFPIQPANTGLLPARLVEFAGDLMVKLSGQGSIFQGETSGRVDSAAGLGFLFNTGNIALGLPANGLGDAFKGIFERILQTAKERMGPGQVIHIATIDDAIAGIVIDQQTGQMRLAENPIPDPWLIAIDVKDRQPKDREIRKQELKEMFGMGLVDPMRFWVTVMEENLDIPGAPREILETWRKATWQIIMLFRDGQTPGNIDTGLHTQNPDVQLVKVQEFMNKIEFSLASEAVRKSFETWKEDLEILSGQRFPVGLSSPEEAAMMEQAGAQQRQGIPQMGIPPGMAPGGPFAV